MDTIATTKRIGLMSEVAAGLRPSHVFATGLLIVPAFVFQTSILLRWLLAAEFMILSVASGKRVRVLPNVIMISGVVAANLITPIGEVLWTVAGFRVTKGALMNGLEKSSLLIGMIYISRWSVRKGFLLPGRLGSLLSLVFFYFEKTLEGERLRRGRLLERIDERVIQVHESAREYEPTEGGGEATRTTPAGWVYLAVLVGLNWALFLSSVSR